MGLKNIKLKQGMLKEEVNKLIGEWVTFEDDVFLGNKHKHNWKCKCDKNTINRIWDKVRISNNIKCKECLKLISENRYKYEVEKCGEYKYLRSFRHGTILPSGKIVKGSPYLQVKHKYCGSVYEVQSGSFINTGSRCNKCCGSYEDSFAYYIEVELGLNIKDVWDFKKNIVNPYHISKNYSKSKVWVKCRNTDYHGSYEVRCGNFVKGYDCSYCTSKEVHLYDSFGYKHFDKVCMNWHQDNKISPFKISCFKGMKCKFICDVCGHIWEATIANISKGKWCPSCSVSKGEKRIKEWLLKNNIIFEREKIYDGLVSDKGVNLRYDFYLPNYNLLIEYQGRQHEDFIEGLHTTYDNFKKQLRHDNLKQNYAKNNNIKLLEIWYYNFDDIENILKKEINL